MGCILSKTECHEIDVCLPPPIQIVQEYQKPVTVLAPPKSTYSSSPSYVKSALPSQSPMEKMKTHLRNKHLQCIQNFQLLLFWTNEMQEEGFRARLLDDKSCVIHPREYQMVKCLVPNHIWKDGYMSKILNDGHSEDENVEEEEEEGGDDYDDDNKNINKSKDQKQFCLTLMFVHYDESNKYSVTVYFRNTKEKDRIFYEDGSQQIQIVIEVSSIDTPYLGSNKIVHSVPVSTFIQPNFNASKMGVSCFRFRNFKGILMAEPHFGRTSMFNNKTHQIMSIKAFEDKSVYGRPPDWNKVVSRVFQNSRKQVEIDYKKLFEYIGRIVKSHTTYKGELFEVSVLYNAVNGDNQQNKDSSLPPSYDSVIQDEI